MLFFARSSLAVGIGKEACEPYKPLVVRITTQFPSSEENGFGFIVGERDEQFYIVTANHVVRSRFSDSPTQKVLLHFSWDPGSKGYKAELLNTMYGVLDLALLRIDKAKVKGADRVRWKGQKWCSRWQQEEEAWFIGRERKWYIPPDRRAGILTGTEPDLRGFIRVDVTAVQPGTSGAPLIIRNGLIGMIITDSAAGTLAVHIDYIRRFVSVENPYPWNLSRYDGDQGENERVTKESSSRSRRVNGEVKTPEGVHSTPQRTRTPEVTLGTASEDPDRARSAQNKTVILERKKQAKVLPKEQPVPQDSYFETQEEEPSKFASDSSPATIQPIYQKAQEYIEAPIKYEPPPPPEPGDLLTEPLTKMKFMRIPEGCFDMGSPKADKKRYNNEVPPHQVCVNAFWMGKYEVTLAQWVKIMKKKPSGSQGGGTHPAVPITWEETQEFIGRLNEKTGLVFRLPTEAEWEYAARAETTTTRYWGDDISCEQAMYGNDANENSCVDYVQQHGGIVGVAAPVGSYPPNEFGLHDMLGNVKEWCADWYGKEYYFSSPDDNPPGPSSSSADPPARVLRGGSWLDGPRIIRSAARKWLSPGTRNYDTGFRLVLEDQ